jgi:hypothetical protein
LPDEASDAGPNVVESVAHLKEIPVDAPFVRGVEVLLVFLDTATWRKELHRKAFIDRKMRECLVPGARR